ncbi:sulfur carrier protein ThiS [uncultured Prevotella sp.]|uniref:sulfur carrier protein ThiS n=1 Tax=uncultured Prevotella sp. TaxID=159272 RepID=UPI002630192F|nr:sulfur carrier protein ThiS [uncultured Prevotella sp.]
MKIRINNKETDVLAESLLDLAKELSLPERGVAVAVNNRMIPRTDWQQTALKDDDNIVIIKAVCGG